MRKSATVCGKESFCHTGVCECTHNAQRCDNGIDCVFCPGSGWWVRDTAACVCTCPLTASSCGAGQVFDPEHCACACSDATTFDCGALCCRRTDQSCSIPTNFGSATCNDVP